ncbi:MAG: hypothetical protein GC168_14870 [Candidatus Hydrogenedens sp.]|nr:hypothetical protein [Candidatus Hydrogenedens sp.]
MKYMRTIVIALTLCIVHNAAIADHVGTAMLCEAIQGSDIAPVERALAQGVDWDTACEAAFNYPLHVAVETGNVELVRLLLEHGAPVDQADAIMGGTPLHAAAANGDMPMVKLLLDNGADVNATDDEGFTVVDAAQAGGQDAMVQRLIALGGSLGRMGEDTTPEAPAPPVNPPAPAGETARYAVSGSPILRGLYLGMPVEAAARVMLDHGLPPGGAPDKPYESGGAWDGIAPLQYTQEGNYAPILRRTGTRFNREVAMYSSWWLELAPSGSVHAIVFLNDTVEPLFNVGDLAAPELAAALAAHFGIEMRPYWGGIQELLSPRSGAWFKSGWACVDRTRGWILAVSDEKHVTLQSIATAADVTF